MNNKLLEQLAQTVGTARTVEALARPLLEMLEAVTGLESTFLTTVDASSGIQQLLCVHNAGSLQLVEGHTLHWTDSPCRRALQDGVSFADDVPARWGDLEVVQRLGLQTYTGTPIHTSDGRLYGTLCALDTRAMPQAAQSQHVLGLFARLIGQEVEREQLVHELLDANRRLASAAATDTLTGLPNRRALMETLQHLLALGRRQQVHVHVAFLDLDGFKAVNDQHGHEVGDQLLAAIAERLRGALRAGDFVARLGGDEFVAVGLGPAAQEGSGSPPGPAAQAWSRRLADATQGRFDLADATLEFAGASVGTITLAPDATHDAADVLRRADEAMYRRKLERKQARG